MHTSENYEVLLANGFRRSGATIYKPHCDNCSACQAIRLSIPDVKFSKSQRRILNKAKSFRWELKDKMDENWFDLYSRYITARHRSGTMYPPKKEEFLQFSQNWGPRFNSSCVLFSRCFWVGTMLFSAAKIDLPHN